MEIDQALDAVGVRMEAPPVLCGKCMKEMVRINPKTLKCPKCNKTFEE
ncbi:MAG: hypothetical protein QF915_04480 [Candidatus Woesearchaeota archaeon]|nr:hypothetical protein [Candidatus Woesearchaeota archaeon]MDP7458130.1 hypothetical protein [Candidatus Woesearchaeota archaeon]